jgi:hypothetical protein
MGDEATFHVSNASLEKSIKKSDVFYSRTIEDVNLTNLSTNISSWTQSMIWVFLHEEFLHKKVL